MTISRISLALSFLQIATPLYSQTATIRGIAGESQHDAQVTVVIDSDRDGLTDAIEREILLTDPYNPDTDGDGLEDQTEVALGKDPLANEYTADPDGAGLLNGGGINLRNGLRAVWGFESVENSEFKDTGGLGFDTAIIDPWSNSVFEGFPGNGVISKSVTIFGPDGYLRSDPAVLAGKAEATLAFWIKMFPVNYSGSDVFCPIFSLQTSTGSAVALSYHFDGDDGRIVFGAGLPGTLSGSSHTIASIKPGLTRLDDHEWHHVVVTIDSQTGVSVRIDNVAAGSPQVIGFPGFSGVTGFDALLGRYLTGNTTHFFIGELDQFLIYDRPLSVNEQQAIFNYDADGDGVSDREERDIGTNPLLFNDDFDYDGLKDAEEIAGQAIFDGVVKAFPPTNPRSKDTDDDGFPDYWEAKYYFVPPGQSVPNVSPVLAPVPIKDDPLTIGSIEGDYDSDELSNLEEMIAGTDPNNADSDGDGVNDNTENENGSDPMDGSKIPFDPRDFFGDETLAGFEPIGALDAPSHWWPAEPDLTTGYASFGEASPGYHGCRRDIWRMRISDRWVDAQEEEGSINGYPTTFYYIEDEPIEIERGKIHQVRMELAGLTHAAHEGEHSFSHTLWATLETSPYDFLQIDVDLLEAWSNRFDGTLLSSYLPDLTHRTAWLIPIERKSSAGSYSGGDAVGPRYRKVSLSGRPLSDEKPQQEEESDAPDEETYIDAYNLSLNHSTTYHYMPIAASDLVIQASASISETGYSDRSGLQPHERLDLPFGAGWTSNLCSYVEVIEQIGQDTDDPITVNVVDEAGRSQRFGTKDMKTFFPWPSGHTDKKSFMNSLVTAADGFTLHKKYGNTLRYEKSKAWFMYSGDRMRGSKTFTRHTYWRLSTVTDRYGASLRYDYDSELGESNEVSLIPRRIYCPERPDHFMDILRSGDSRRVEAISCSVNGGVRTTFFDYTDAPLVFDDQGIAEEPVVVPTAAVSRLWRVRYPDGTELNYQYKGTVEQKVELIPKSTNSLPYYPVLGGDSNMLKDLTHYFHVNVGSITDKRGNTHVFNYGIDHSKFYSSSVGKGLSWFSVDIQSIPEIVRGKALFEINAIREGERMAMIWENLQINSPAPDPGFEIMYGMPLKVTSVELPGGGSSTFQSVGETRFADQMGVPIPPVTTVTDAEMNLTVYEFQNIEAKIVDVDVTQSSKSTEWMVYYLTSKIHHGGPVGSSSYIGTEEYTFDPASGLSLKSAKDLSGNITTWDFGQNYQHLPPVFGENSQLMTKWADPTAKIDSLSRTETYRYSDFFRIMDQTVDPYGTTTTFSVDNLGRRTAKVVTGIGGLPLQEEVYRYDNQRFKGFQTSKTVKAFSNHSGQAWEADLVTIYVPDSRGKVWKEIVDPGGLNLVTEHAYDVNNNRLHTTDPRGSRTKFEYDKLNRLVKVTFPPAGTGSGLAVSTKEIWYDFNGNKATEIDEEGNYTIHHYDSRNRRVATIKDMDGMGLPLRNEHGLVSQANRGSVTGGDLVTYFGYNQVGSVVVQTDPRGVVTRTFYDAIQRPIHVFTGLTAVEAAGDLAACTALAMASSEKTHTEFRYTNVGLVLPEGGVVKGNPGGSGFDTSGFKPTEVIRHHVVKTSSGTSSMRTFAAYDALYRPLRTETEFEPGAFSVATTLHGDGTVNAVKEALQSTSTDDRGKVTLTFKDGLQRQISVTDGFGSPLASTTQTYYSSTGFAWKTIDPLGRESETEYDGAGRPVVAWSPDPITGLVERGTPNDPIFGSPRTMTEYDKGGNAIATINPLGIRWEYGFDARNRRIRERQPSVSNTEIISGQVVESTPMNQVIITSFDGIGNVISVTNPRGHITRNFRDRAYRVIATLSNPVVTAQPAVNWMNPGQDDILTQTIFDPNGNVLEVIDGNGNVTRNQYDALNRLIATATNPGDGQPNAPPAAPKSDDIVVSNEYDDAGNLVKVTDGESHVTGFRYDGLARKTRTIWDEGSAAQKVEEATYDGLVQLSRKDAKGQEVDFQYDALHRLKQVLYGGLPSDNRLLEYDLVGNLTSVSYPHETAARQNLRGTGQTYDELDRLVAETSAGVTHVHTYDKAGNRRTTEYGATGRTLANTYDALNRLLTMTESGNGVTIYGYDFNGNVTRKTVPNGMTMLNTFDALNRRLTAISRRGGALVSSFDYSQPAGGYPTGYDKVGNILKILEDYGRVDVKDRVVINTYDRAYRLTHEAVEEAVGPTILTGYEYDKANNRVIKTVSGGTNAGTWTYALGDTADGYNSNQVKSVTKGATVTTFHYDANGNRDEKKVGGTTVQAYGYDYDNRLNSVIDSAKGTFSYVYDHRTRRVERNESAAGGDSIKLSFAGGLSVQEYASGNALPAVEIIRGSDYGGGVGGVLYTIRGGVPSYNAYNSRGDVVSKTDDTGVITWQASYEAYGARTQEQGLTEDRQKGNTKDEDPTGLLNEGFRYRDLEFGIFLTRDPMGFVDGPNVYTYVRQNPWAKFDPLGLWTWNDTWDFSKGHAKGVWSTGLSTLKGVGMEAWNSHPLVNVGQAALGVKTGYQQKFEAGMSTLNGIHSLATSSESRTLAGKAVSDYWSDATSSPGSVGEKLTGPAAIVVADILVGTKGSGLTRTAKDIIEEGSEVIVKIEKSSSSKLRKNMAAADRPVGPDEAAHHIVAGNDPRAAPARARLEADGIPINDESNGVGLPKNNKVPNPDGKTVHSTMHTNEYYDLVNERLTNAPEGGTKDTLRDLAKELEKKDKDD